jgi:hypothetical protein
MPMNDDIREHQRQTTAAIRTLSVWSVERIRRVGPSTFDAIFAALIEAARLHPEAIVKVGFGPDGPEVEAYPDAPYDPATLLYQRAWFYDYPE